jgi:hypothetical protein
MTMDTYNEDVELFTKERKGDERLAVRFFRKAARDDVKSDAEGRMVFKDVEYIQIMVPGDRDNVIVRPAGEGDKRRFGQQYEDWKRNEGAEQMVIGTPLEMWGRLSVSQIEEFRYIGVRSVEQLAELNDGAMLKMPGAVEFKRKAQAFIQAQKDEAPMRKLQAELESRDQALAQQGQQIRDQGEALENMREQMERLILSQTGAKAEKKASKENAATADH